jgi:hypothetical protein
MVVGADFKTWIDVTNILISRKRYKFQGWDLVNFLILRLCNFDKSPDHVESGYITLKEVLKKKYKSIKALMMFKSAA